MLWDSSLQKPGAWPLTWSRLPSSELSRWLLHCSPSKALGPLLRLECELLWEPKAECWPEKHYLVVALLGLNWSRITGWLIKAKELSNSYPKTSGIKLFVLSLLGFMLMDPCCHTGWVMGLKNQVINNCSNLMSQSQAGKRAWRQRKTVSG